jgi:hypothetical protein
MERPTKPKKKLKIAPQFSFAEQKGCLRKKPYFSRTAAKRAKRQLKRRYGWENYIYSCRFCGFRHLATRPH